MSVKYTQSYTSICDISGGKIGQTLVIGGWVRTCRIQTAIGFIEVFDGSSAKTLQCVTDVPELLTTLKPLCVGAAVLLEGTLVESPVRGQAFELRILSIKHVGPIADPSTYLLNSKKLGLDTLRENQHIRPKTRAFNSIFRIRAGLMHATHAFFKRHGFNYLNPNIVTTSDCEGAGEVFTITNLFKKAPADLVKSGSYDFSADFFQKQAYLTVSSQLQLELLCAGLGKVWTSNKSLRAEHSKSNRHLAEFEHIEWEFAYVNLDQLMDFSEEYTQSCFRYVLLEHADDLAELDKFISKGIVEKLRRFAGVEYARITYDAAVGMITEHADAIKAKYGLKTLPIWGDDLGSQCEQYICEVLTGKPTFVYNYPKDLKSFYMKANDDGRTVQACDLLIPGLGELIGSSVRESDFDALCAVMSARHMDVSKLEWYTEIRKNGTFPHAGAGLGFDRLVSVCCLMGGNIRDVVPFPVSYQECRF
jgi:asparaginyl-tRNA synthetase